MASAIKRSIVVLSLFACALGVYWIGRASFIHGELRLGNPVGDQAHGVGLVTPGSHQKHLRAEISRVRGHAARVGQVCEVVVERRELEQGDFYCNAQVRCDSRLLYGGPNRGFFRCEWSESGRGEIIGTDGDTTRADHDAALFLDTSKSVLRVWDDGSGPLGEFDVEAELTQVE